jgi:hypothetical protein
LTLMELDEARGDADGSEAIAQLMRDHCELLADVPVAREAICGAFQFLLPQVRRRSAVRRWAPDHPHRSEAKRVGEKRRIGRQSVEWARPSGPVMA